MAKIVLSLMVASSLVLANDKIISEEKLKVEIAEATAHKKALESRIKNLQLKLPHAKLTARAELGFMQTQGNTDTDTFNLDLNIKKAGIKFI